PSKRCALPPPGSAAIAHAGPPRRICREPLALCLATWSPDMADTTWLDWPFFDDHHRDRAAELEAWCIDALAHIDHHDTDAACRKLVAALGQAGWLRYCVPAGPDGAWGGAL